MCNRYRRAVALGQVEMGFSHTRMKLRFPQGRPNMAPVDIAITDPGTVIRASAEESGPAELVQLRWSWPGPGGRPVYNYRSEGRRFTSGRCLIVADSFYEYTAPADPKQKRKDRWRFSKAGEEWFCIAGLWRPSELGEAFTMLTTAPGPDVAPYHHRQVAVLDRADWAAWLNPDVPAAEVLRPLPAGTLAVETA